MWLRLRFLSVHELLYFLGELEKQQGAKTLSFKSGGAQVDPQSKQGSPTGEPGLRTRVPDPRPDGQGLGHMEATPHPGHGFLGDVGEGSAHFHGPFFLLRSSRLNLMGFSGRGEEEGKKLHQGPGSMRNSAIHRGGVRPRVLIVLPQWECLVPSHTWAL